MDGFGTPFASFLDSDEKLLWSGQPKQGLRLQAGDFVMIPFSLMWGGFAIFWEATALGFVKMNPHEKPAPIFMALWGIPFVLAGLQMMVGRFFYDAALRKRTWYGVTDKRLIISKALFGKSVTSFDYANLQNLNLIERGDHSGDIQFALPMSPEYMTQTRRNRRVTIPGFYLVPDARNVYSRILAAQSQAKK